MTTEVISLPGEVFKTFIKDKYLLSNYGRMFSLKANRLLKPNKNSCGYIRYGLIIDKKFKHCFAHINVVRLFGDAKGQLFSDEIIDKNMLLGLNIDHINGDKNNNSVWNLEIVSHAENMRRLKERLLREAEEDPDRLPY